jgi:hypothetical protein
MIRNAARICIIVGYALTAAFTSVAAADEFQVGRSDATLPAKMRELWDAKTTWTRMYVISELGNLPDTGFARLRVLRCADDIGRAVEAYYGRAAADEFAQTLRRHLVSLMMFVTATKYGKAEAIDAVRQRLRADAESVAVALGRINPAWSEPSFRELFDVYLQLTEREITLRAKGDYSTDIANFGELHEVAQQLAEVLARDILKQFQPRLAPAKP